MKTQKTKAFLRYKTKITKANTNSSSLRTTIPIEIVKLLNLKENDFIEWIIEFKNNSISISILPAKKEDTNENQT